MQGCDTKYCPASQGWNMSKLCVETCWNMLNHVKTIIAQSDAGDQYRHSTLISPTSLVTVASIIPPTHDASSICRPASRRSFRSPALLQVQPLAPCWIYACHGRCNVQLAHVAIKHWGYSIKRILWLYFWLNWWNNPRIKDIQWTRTCIVSHVHQTLLFASHIFEQCAWGIQEWTSLNQVSHARQKQLPWTLVCSASNLTLKKDARYCLVISTPGQTRFRSPSS